MEAHATHADHHHEMPTEGRALTGVAVSATLHCLTGCAIGEVAGVAIGTALGFSDAGTIALAIALAFLFGYALTSLPLLRAGLALAAVIPIALASDTLSIATMEVVDNAILLVIPGAMEAGLSDILFWGSLSFALVIAFLVAVPVNRWLLARGKGHCAVHETGIHGGPPTRVVGAATIVAAIFGLTVLIAEAIGDDGAGHEESMTATASDQPAAGHAENTEEGTVPATNDTDAVRGMTVADGGLGLELEQTELPLDRTADLSFRIVSDDGEPVTDFDVEHERQMHLIVVRRDLTGFQHLHPEMSANGTWSTPIRLPDAGSYKVFADFAHDGAPETLGADLAVDGTAEYQELPLQQTETEIGSGYEVGVEGAAATAGEESELAFNVALDGELIEVDPYLGANGHLVALREGDLAFLHVHPIEDGGHGVDALGKPGAIRFMTEFPSEGNYRLFLQFKHDGEVQTAAFTREVTR